MACVRAQRRREGSPRVEPGDDPRSTTLAVSSYSQCLADQQQTRWRILHLGAAPGKCKCAFAILFYSRSTTAPLTSNWHQIWSFDDRREFGVCAPNKNKTLWVIVKELQLLDLHAPRSAGGGVEVEVRGGSPWGRWTCISHHACAVAASLQSYTNKCHTCVNTLCAPHVWTHAPTTRGQGANLWTLSRWVTNSSRT